MEPKYSIDFYVNSERYAVRYYWYAAPRVGDEVMLGAGKQFEADASGKAAFGVKRVVWGIEQEDALRGVQYLNIEVEPL